MHTTTAMASTTSFHLWITPQIVEEDRLATRELAFGRLVTASPASSMHGPVTGKVVALRWLGEKDLHW